MFIAEQQARYNELQRAFHLTRCGPMHLSCDAINAAAPCRDRANTTRFRPTA
jgi:hypothetical protein